MNKKLVFAVSLSILALLIVLPVAGSFNNSAGNHTIWAPALVAEGNPMPPPVPPKATHVSILVAEGNPMPPPVPPSTRTNVLVAEGNPMPVPVPPRHASVFTAQGNPMPPPVPPNVYAA
jgi:hypothetical protein